MKTDTNVRTRKLVRYLDRSLDDQERLSLLNWARQLQMIRASAATPAKRARAAIAVSVRADLAKHLATRAGRLVVRVAWADRGWPARIGMGAAVAAAAVGKGQGAGVAAFGTAIGVPLWVVFGAGGSFLGVVAEELQRSLGPRAELPPAEPLTELLEGEVIDLRAEDWTVLERPAEEDAATARLLPPGPKPRDLEESGLKRFQRRLELLLRRPSGPADG